tara:strand:+ start:1260 stop:2357 length:1098 start_codon:yes stop_codon:yes gene_type:complete
MEGGTSSSKTWTALQGLIVIAQEATVPMMISVVSESIPHLKRGVMRDFFNIIGESQDNNPRWSKTEFTYRWPKCSMEFFGADDDSKVRGPRRDILFINEGNNIPWETARGLDIRTSRFTIVDWNPVAEYWAHDYWLDNPDTAYSHSTYRDAAGVLPAQVVIDIEGYKDKDPNWWNIYGLGLLGKVEGLVYPIFEQVDELPVGAVFYGIDFGYASDPTVLVKNVVLGDKLYSKQMFYDNSGLTNGQIAQRLSLLDIQNEPIYPDPAEPKSAEEIRQLGFNVIDSIKGKGSVEYGIQKVNNYYQAWTKDSLDCIKEQRSFRYIKDRQSGLYTERTTHQWSHGMDARRYAVATHEMLYKGRKAVVQVV